MEIVCHGDSTERLREFDQKTRGENANLLHVKTVKRFWIGIEFVLRWRCKRLFEASRKIF